VIEWKQPETQKIELETGFRITFALSLVPFACFLLTIPSKEVFLQSVQRGIETLLKIYEVSSTADKGGSRGVIEDKTPFLGKEGGVFCFFEWGADVMSKTRPKPNVCTS